MQKGNLFTDKRSLIILLTVFVVVIADLLTKEWVRSYPLSEVIQRIGFVQIIHIQNTGAAFGVFQGHSLILAVLAVVEIGALLTLAYYVHKHYPYLVTKWNQIALGLILAGAVGNLIDRIRFGGAVTDFIDPGFWPAFNVADSGVTIGAVILAVTVLRLAMKGKN